MTHTCETAESTRELGSRIAQSVPEGSIISLRGPLGAGKTIFVKGMAEALGITEQITSPTYTLIEQYHGLKDLDHLDLYRLDSVEDFYAIGGEELLYSNSITVIEWSEVIDEILPEMTIFIELKILEDGSRSITIEGGETG